MRPSKTEMAERREAVRERLARGMRTCDIARDLGLSYTKVYGLIARDPVLQANRATPRTPAAIARSMGVRLGTLGPALENQSPEFLRWLAETAPEGATISDWIVSIALDQFLEENPAALRAA